MRIAAVADIHSPRYVREFEQALASCATPDLFLLAGDIIDQNAAAEYPRVVSLIRDSLGSSFPIVGCFGNQEYTETRKDISALVTPEAILLDEKDLILTVDDTRVGIVGTQGSLNEPTSWQRRNIPRVRMEFERRAQRAEMLLQRVRPRVDRVILLMHYGPCADTCRGESEQSLPWVWSKRFQEVVEKERPDLVVHGHAHRSVVHEAWIGETLVLNVSFPAVGRITEIRLWD